MLNCSPLWWSCIALEKSQSERDHQPVVRRKGAFRGHAMVWRRCEAGIWAELLINRHYVPLLSAISSLTNLFHLTTGILHLLLLLLSEWERERDREIKWEWGRKKVAVLQKAQGFITNHVWWKRVLDCQAKKSKITDCSVHIFHWKCCEESFLHNSGNALNIHTHSVEKLVKRLQGKKVNAQAGVSIVRDWRMNRRTERNAGLLRRTGGGFWVGPAWSGT